MITGNLLICSSAQMASDISYTLGRLLIDPVDRAPHCLDDTLFQVFTRQSDVRGGLHLLDNYTFAVSPRVRGHMDDPQDASGLQAALAACLPEVLLDGLTTLDEMRETFRGAQSLSVTQLLPYIKPELLVPIADAVADGWLP